MAGCPLRSHYLFTHLLEAALAREDDPRAEQMVEEQVSVGELGGVSAQDDHAPQPACGGRGRGLPGMIRLHRAERNQSVGVPAQGLGNAELELARLVAADREPGLVVALHEDARAAQRPGQARQLVQWCGQLAEANARKA